MMRSLKSGTLLFLFLAVLGNTFANGMLVPRQPDLPPFAVKSQRVVVTIKDRVSQTHVTQVFKNNTNQHLEAVFVFPLPKGASINDFALTCNGKRLKGEVLDKDKARKTYTDIVRRMKDPGLIEYMGNNLFKASIFPIPPHGEQKVEIAFAQVIPHDAGITEYIYPLKTSHRPLDVIGDFTVLCNITSRVPIKSIYSPTHKIDVVRKSDKEAKISFEQRSTQLNRDFQLFYTNGDNDIDLRLVASRPDKEKDGHFLLMLAPRVEWKENELPAKDVCFVIDTSGSMSGEKMDQARKSLVQCINRLNAKDRFNIVRFSTDVQPFSSKLQYADAKTRADATEFAKKLEARGGTDINEAIMKAISMREKSGRPFLVVFLTDGHPTIGVIDRKEILRNVKKQNTQGARIFVFGVGNELNTLLLDQLASDSGAATQYVRAGENIEVKVSSFFDKVNSPVLTQLELDLGKSDAYDLYPKKISDLFRGQQLLVFGRYRKSGHVAIKLRGMMSGKKKEFVYEAKFPEHEATNNFIPALWGRRKVGFLLSEIRQHGETKELMEEVVRLAREYGIVTPYTSYLVVEDDIRTLPRPPRPPRPWPHPRPRPIPLRRGVAPEEGVQLDKAMKEADIADEVTEKPAANTPLGARYREVAKKTEEKRKMAAERVYNFGAGMSRVDGKNAVTASQSLARMKDAEVAADDDDAMLTVAPVHLGKNVYFQYRGIWISRDWLKKKPAPVKIKYLSEAWFKLIQLDSSLRKPLALGKAVLVVLPNGKAVLVCSEGKESLTDAEAKEILN